MARRLMLWERLLKRRKSEPRSNTTLAQENLECMGRNNCKNLGTSKYQWNLGVREYHKYALVTVVGLFQITSYDVTDMWGIKSIKYRMIVSLPAVLFMQRKFGTKRVLYSTTRAKALRRDWFQRFWCILLLKVNINVVSHRTSWRVSNGI